MARVVPFCGLHYDPERVSVAAVIAPPYDVLSPAQQQELLSRDSANIVRLILSPEREGDNELNNRYTRANDFLSECLRDGVIVRDRQPALYVYVQRFEHPLEPGRIVERQTLFVALGLEPYGKGVVLPHELTHPKAKADRLELMRATHSNPEPIYGLYEDPELELSRIVASERARGMAPLVQAAFPTSTRPDGEAHLLYRLDDPELIARIQGFFEPRRVWIADGHHRYETALNYQRERREADGNPDGSRPYDYLLIGLSAFEDPGLVVLPTHRLVRNVGAARMEQLALQLARYFEVRSTTTAEAREWIGKHEPGNKRFALLVGGGAYALTLRDMRLAEAAQEPGHCPAWGKLDVTILQALVLDRTLGISWEELAHTPDVAYTRDEGEAAARVQSGEFQIACLLQNPTVTEVRDVAAAGDKMPQKSTFFYPKIWSGLVLRSLE